MLEPSILKSTKKILGLDPGYDAFDLDVITHINSAFSTLSQLGVGPKSGFFIDGETQSWSDYYGDDPFLNMVRSYVYLKVRLAFDPPSTSFAITAIEEQLKEMEFRMMIVVDPGGDVAYV